MGMWSRLICSVIQNKVSVIPEDQTVLLCAVMVRYEIRIRNKNDPKNESFFAQVKLNVMLQGR